MTILITLTTVGIDCSTFDIYSNVDGFLSAFETDVPKASLSAGFSSANVPDGTTVIRVKAKGLCSNYIDLQLINATTTTTTSIPPECLLYSMTTDPVNITGDMYIRYRDCTTGNVVDTLVNALLSSDNLDGTFTHYVCIKQNSSYAFPIFVINYEPTVLPYTWVIDSECSPIV